jgi:hypothetical protein
MVPRLPYLPNNISLKETDFIANLYSTEMRSLSIVAPHDSVNNVTNYESPATEMQQKYVRLYTCATRCRQQCFYGDFTSQETVRRN